MRSKSTDELDFFEEEESFDEEIDSLGLDE